MQIGVAERDRKLSKVKNLLVAEDGSPVVFVNVKGMESRGQNDREISVLMNLLFDLVKKSTLRTWSFCAIIGVQMDAVKAKIDSESFRFHYCTVIFQTEVTWQQIVFPSS